MSAQRAEGIADHGNDASMLARSVENIFRHIARLLVGKMTLRRAQTMFREVFVQEAEARLRRERPGKNVPLSQLALLTGLDTRTLIRIRGDLANRQLEGDREPASTQLSTEAKLVDMWSLHPDYRDAAGEPRALSFNVPGSDFETLVKRVNPARGVTPQSILERLLATRSVEVDTDRGELHLLTERYSPFNSEDEQSLVSIGLQAMINLTETVSGNVNASKNQRLFQREIWTFRLDEDRREEFRTAMRAFLVRAESDANALISPIESEFEYDDQVTAGIGLYYFEQGFGRG